MSISLACFNCGWGIFGSAVRRVDSASCDVTCTRCEAVYRVQVTCLHDGKAIDLSHYGYTYDANGNKIALPNVQSTDKS